MGGLHGRIFQSAWPHENPHIQTAWPHENPHDRIFGPHMRPHGQNRMEKPHGRSEHGCRPHTHMRPMRPHFKTLHRILYMRERAHKNIK